MVYRAPQCWAWALSLCFCFFHLILSIIVLGFLLKIFGFWIFLHAPSFIWTLLMIEKFLLCPPVLLGHFQSLRFFSMFFTLAPPVWGVILVKVISKKCYQAQKGTAKDIFQPCERIIKDDLSSFQTHAFRIGKPCFHANM